MSLDFKFNAIVDTPEGMQWIWPEYHSESNPRVPMNPKVESIILATMTVGINKITIDNYGDFYKRYRMVTRAAGYNPYFNLSDVFNTIGLTTNASSYTEAAFKKHVYAIMEREINWAVSKEVKALNEEKDSNEV